MSESAKLTIKVKLHPAPTPLSADIPPAAVTTHWSVPRILLALTVLLLLSAGAWWVLAESVPAATVLSANTTATPSSVASETSVPPTQQPVVTTLPAPADPVDSASSSKVLSTAQPSSSVASSATPSVPTTASVTATSLPSGFSRIVLTAQMERLEPGTPLQDQVDRSRMQRLYLFTELRGYAGQQLRHRWWYQGELQTEALLTIEDSPWRTYSEKWLLPTQTGLWRVEIVDQTQNVLYQHDFQYQ